MAEDELLKRGAVKNGDYIVLTIGEPFGKAGGTNTMKIVRVGEHRAARESGRRSFPARPRRSAAWREAGRVSDGSPTRSFLK